jgi:hypothetical protein
MMKQQQVQPQTDVAGIANAMGNAMRTGAELAKGNGNADPMSALNVVTPLLKEQTEIVRQSYEGQLALVREQLKNKDPEAELGRIAKYRDMMGWGQQESEQIAIHKLHAAQENSKMAFDLEREKWRNELQVRSEDRKQKQQASLIQSVTGSLEKLVESPVLQQLGRNVGNKIGMPANPLSVAKTQTAQNQLENPLDTPFAFTCAKCHSDYKFTTKELSLIEEKPNKLWVCPKCGESYRLNSGGGSSGKPGGPGAPMF